MIKEIPRKLLTTCNRIGINKAISQLGSHGLRQLVDDKCVASSQQTSCKLIVAASCFNKL